MKFAYFSFALSLISFNIFPAARGSAIEVIFANKIAGKNVIFSVEYPGSAPQRGEILPNSIYCYELNPGARNISVKTKTGAERSINILPNNLNQGDIITIHAIDENTIGYKINNAFAESELKQEKSVRGSMPFKESESKSCKEDLAKAQLRIKELESILKAFE